MYEQSRNSRKDNIMIEKIKNKRNQWWVTYPNEHGRESSRRIRGTYQDALDFLYDMMEEAGVL